MTLYCWTHGTCNHLSANCFNPLPSHHATTTFENRMNGCDFYCQPVANNISNQTDTPYTHNTTSSTSNNYILAKADSGALNHYWREEDKKVLNNVMPFDGPNVTLANNTSLKSNEEGKIPLSPLLSNNAKKHLSFRD